MKKTAARKPAAKKPAAKRPAAKKAAVKKPAAKKSTAKKSPAKKTVARKTAVRPAPKKAMTKPAARKPATKKATLARKPVKKPAPRKPATKKAAARVAIPVAAVAPAPKPVLTGLLAVIMPALEDAKAEATITIDLTGKSTIADWMVVANGRSNRHVAAIAEQLVEKLKAAGSRDLRVEGLPQADWVLVDAGDAVVHLFRPEVRSFYNLEKLWSEHAPRDDHRHG